MLEGVPPNMSTRRRTPFRVDRPDRTLHRRVDLLHSHLRVDVHRYRVLDFPDDDLRGAQELGGKLAVGNQYDSDQWGLLPGGDDLRMSRWTTLGATGLGRERFNASATTTDRCLPPVHPTPSVK